MSGKRYAEGQGRWGDVKGCERCNPDWQTHARRLDTGAASCCGAGGKPGRQVMNWRGRADNDRQWSPQQQLPLHRTTTPQQHLPQHHNTRLDPLEQLGQPLVLLALVVALRQVDQVHHRLGGQELQQHRRGKAEERMGGFNAQLAGVCVSGQGAPGLAGVAGQELDRVAT